MDLALLFMVTAVTGKVRLAGRQRRQWASHNLAHPRRGPHAPGSPLVESPSNDQAKDHVSALLGDAAPASPQQGRRVRARSRRPRTGPRSRPCAHSTCRALRSCAVKARTSA